FEHNALPLARHHADLRPDDAAIILRREPQGPGPAVLAADFAAVDRPGDRLRHDQLQHRAAPGRVQGVRTAIRAGFDADVGRIFLHDPGEVARLALVASRLTLWQKRDRGWILGNGFAIRVTTPAAAVGRRVGHIRIADDE